MSNLVRILPLILICGTVAGCGAFASMVNGMLPDYRYAIFLNSGYVGAKSVDLRDLDGEWDLNERGKMRLLVKRVKRVKRGRYSLRIVPVDQAANRETGEAVGKDGHEAGQGAETKSGGKEKANGRLDARLFRVGEDVFLDVTLPKRKVHDLADMLSIPGHTFIYVKPEGGSYSFHLLNGIALARCLENHEGVMAYHRSGGRFVVTNSSADVQHFLGMKPLRKILFGSE